MTVLVVDDADGLRRLAKVLLERHGYTVVVAAEAQEAIRLFDENRAIDVLLTDVVMPGLSGPALASLLVERRPGLRVVYMSGFGEEATSRQGVLTSGISFLHKPFTSETLSQAIAEAMKGPAAAA